MGIDPMALRMCPRQLTHGQESPQPTAKQAGLFKD